MPIKDHIGKKVGPYREPVTESRLAAFRAAIGAEPCEGAPPTFLTVCRRGEFDLFQAVGVSLASILHGEQTYTFEGATVLAGDTLVYETVLANALEKQSSKSSLRILTLETQVAADRAGAQVKIGTSKTVVVIRGKN